MSAKSVRMSALACPPTFSRVAGPQRVVERLLVGVHEEVDRLGLGDAEKLLGLARPRPRPILSARSPNALSPWVQWTRTMSPETVCQS